MKSTADVGLLERAYAIIDGIPDKAVALGQPCSRIGKTLARGTVCSPDGWLALHPEFRAMGLTISKDGKQIYLQKRKSERTAIAPLMAALLNLSEAEATALFSLPARSRKESAALSDKEFWLAEVRSILAARRASALADQATTSDVVSPEETAIATADAAVDDSATQQADLSAGAALVQDDTSNDPAEVSAGQQANGAKAASIEDGDTMIAQTQIPEQAGAGEDGNEIASDDAESAVEPQASANQSVAADETPSMPPQAITPDAARDTADQAESANATGPA